MVDVTLVSTGMAEQLNKWNAYLLARDIENATKIRNSLTILHENNVTAENEQLFLHAKLIELKHSLFIKDTEKSKELLTVLDPLKVKMSESLQFYYYFFTGLHAYQELNYDIALKEFKKAEKFVDQIQEKVDLAEYHYKIASTYYFIRQSLVSLIHLEQAQQYYEQHGNTKRVADCDMLYGINYIDMRQYDLAEEKLHTALMHAKSLSDQPLQNRVLHNLGFFYAEQGMSEAAIRYLKSLAADENYEHYLKAVFLISRENCRLGDLKESQEWISKGLNHLQQNPNEEYLHKFQLLKLLYLEPNNINDELISKGISYFKENKQWEDVEEYSRLIAQTYSKSNELEKAVYFYESALNAGKTINFMEALK
ncbi:hypothetical protein ACTWQL_04805 [Pseudalkalibacillus sp. R45]|uniref:hypothetical protein n=1 Tax=Pseudalkalibacillus sp. R45 TaxID=3457433 RepID=UPI003FCC92BA